MQIPIQIDPVPDPAPEADTITDAYPDPNPKCKFGRNDRIVDASYVRCTEEPLTVD